MDDIVKQAMAKWPNVPNCYGWLGLDERGHWYLRDDAAQARGSFQSGVPGAKGSLLQHEKLIEFIHRNYAAACVCRVGRHTLGVALVCRFQVDSANRPRDSGTNVFDRRSGQSLFSNPHGLWFVAHHGCCAGRGGLVT